MISRIALPLLMAALLAGCIDYAKLEREQVVRRQLFKECMALAAKLERKADDDVADVVNACSTQSHYMAIGTP